MPGIDEFRSDIAIVKSEIVYLRKDVNRMLELLLDNPDHAVSPRIKVLEMETADLKEKLDQIEERSWQGRLAMAIAAVGFLSSVIVLILEIKFRNGS